MKTGGGWGGGGEGNKLSRLGFLNVVLSKKPHKFHPGIVHPGHKPSLFVEYM